METCRANVTSILKRLSTMHRTVVVLALLARACGARGESPDGFGSKPHLVVLLADNVGWANVDWHRPPGWNESATPFMHSLLSQSIELNRNYVNTIEQQHTCRVADSDA